jgi:hypothetical protein
MHLKQYQLVVGWIAAMTALVIFVANEESTRQPFVIAFGVGIAGLLLLWLVSRKHQP